MFILTDEMIVLRGIVGASQKTSGTKQQTQRQVTIVCRASGSQGCRVVAAACSCPAGNSMTCAHVSAILHQVIDLLGMRSPTSKVCRWVAPTTSVTPMAVDAIVPKKHIINRPIPKRSRSRSRVRDLRDECEIGLAPSLKRLQFLTARMCNLRRLQGETQTPLKIHFPVGCETVGLNRPVSRLPDNGEDDKKKILEREKLNNKREKE